MQLVNPLTPPPMPGPTAGHGEGYCYLHLIREDAREKARLVLGANPYLVVVLAWLQSNISVWAAGKFRLELGGQPLPGDGRAFIQAHLEPSQWGLTITQLLTCSAGGVRLGGRVALGEMARGMPSFAQAVKVPVSVATVNQYPLNLPDPKSHPVVLVDGLYDWFKSLSREPAGIFLRYLFSFDTNYTAQPGLFLQPLSTHRLAAVYDMCQWPDRVSFASKVRWRGVDDENLPPFKADSEAVLPYSPPEFFMGGFDHQPSKTLLGNAPSEKPAARTFPISLPDPRTHPVILVYGLRGWFDTLSKEYQRLFLRYLLDFDPDRQDPAPDLFLKPVSTHRLAAVYDMSPWQAREAFLGQVHPRGFDGETPKFADGFCYLALLKPEARSEAAKALGLSPTAQSIRAYPLATGGFRVQLTGVHTYHVEASPGGLLADEALRAIPDQARVGTSTGDKLAFVEAGVSTLPIGPSTGFDVIPAGPRTTLTLAMFATLDKGQRSSAISWTPLAQPAFVVMLGVYESVRLESAEFNIAISSGQANTCWCAIANSSAASPVSMADWYGCPVVKVIDGSDNGSVVSTFALPAEHSFAKELRASASGNDPPRFHFGYAGVAGGSATVMGRFVVSVSGQKPLGAFDANPIKAPKVSREVRRLMATMPPVHDSVCSRGEDEDSEDEDDDEDEPAAAPSPPARASPPGRPVNRA